MISNQTFASQIEPFPASTVLISENNGTTLTMYMIDRNFIFYVYDASDFNNGKVIQKQKIQLNTSIINESCHDLTLIQYLEYQQSLITFCRSETFTPEGDIDQIIYTIVQIDLNNPKPDPNSFQNSQFHNSKYNKHNYQNNNNDQQDNQEQILPTVRYISFKQTLVYMDFIGGIQFIGFENRTDGSLIALFLSNQILDFWDQYYQQIIFQMNFSEFIQMKNKNITYQYSLQSTIKVKYQIQYDSIYYGKDVSNFGIVNREPLMVSVIFENIGLMLCQFTDSDIYQPISWTKFYATIDCGSKNTSQLLQLKNALSLYQNPQDPNYFYVSLSSPPGVVEINIEDPYNAYVFKKYQLTNEAPAYIGLRTIAANKNLIVHQMDERRINVTTFFDYKLSLDGTNLTWVEVFKYQIFQVNLTVRNAYTSIQSLFNVTFVDENFTEVITSGEGENEQKIFYNCGDDNFKYRISDLFDGPNFNLSYNVDDEDDCQEGYCYFTIVNQDIKQQYQSNFDDINCNENYIYPDIENLNDESDPIILVCIESENSALYSYKLVQQNQTLQLLNKIQIPQIKFLFTGYNVAERSLFIISETTDEDWLDYNNEVHFFQIQRNILWKNFTSSAIDLEGFNLSDMIINQYNANVNKGIMISQKANQTEQIMIYYDVNNTLTQFSVQAIKIQKVDSMTEIQLVAISQEGFVYTLQANQMLKIYQIMLVNKQYTFVQLKQKQLDNGNYRPNQMDIHQNFFIIYYGSNEILVYSIKNYIDLVYKMRLPFYNEYSGFKFNLFHNPHMPLQGQSIRKDYYDQFLSILMINPDYHGRKSLRIFIFSLGDYQHNSFVLTKDFTDFFYGALNRSVVLTGNSIHTSMFLISEQKLAMFDVEFYNYIQLRDHIEYRKQLLEKCSQYKILQDSQGIISDNVIEIANLKLKGTLMFSSSNNEEKYNNRVLLKIYSQNQGIVVTQTDYQSARKQLYFSSGDSSNEELSLSIENLVEGYNMSYQMDCFYIDEDGVLHNCAQSGVQDYTHSQSYSFYIEFVTQMRQVVRSFTLGNLFIMFDSLNMITVQTLQDNNRNLNDINGMALDQKGEFQQQDKLGCNLYGFITIYDCLWIDEDPQNPYNLFLAFYECKLDQSLYLKMATIKIYDHKDDSEIKVLDGQLKIPYRVLAIDRSNITVSNNDKSKINVTIGISMEIPGSSTNIFETMNLTIDIGLNKIHFSNQNMLTATKLGKDTFKTGQVLRIPNSNLLFIVDTFFGIYIYDLDSLQILKEFNLMQDNQFNDQSYRELGPLQVYSLAGGWPYSIHIITNYGIFIYNFKVNLCERSEIFPYYNDALIPIQKRIIRYEFDQFNNELASNDYGYAFLVTKQSSKNQFDVYLGVVSLFASSASKLFKIIKVATNQQCSSLNIEKQLIDSSYDELTVSFICNTQFYIVRTCLRPSFKINMQSYSDSSTKLKNSENIPGVLQYNQFNLTLRASNEYNKDGLNEVVVEINLNQKTFPDQKSPEFYLICVFILCISITLIMYFAIGGGKYEDRNSSESNLEEDQIPKMSFSDNRNSTMLNHKSTFIPGTTMKLLNLQTLNLDEKQQKQQQEQQLPNFGDASEQIPLNKVSKDDSLSERLNSKNLNGKKSVRISKTPQFEIISSETIPNPQLARLSRMTKVDKKDQ